MIQLGVSEAQKRLSELLDEARAGEVVEIQQNGWTFRLTAVAPRPKITGVPKAGRLKGLLVVPDALDEPLEELRESWEWSCRLTPMPSCGFKAVIRS